MAKNSEKVYSYFLPLFFQTEYKTTYQQNFSQLASAKTGVLFLNLAALACNSANNYRIQWTHISSRNICGKREPQMWGKLPSTCLWCLATVSWSSETLSWRCVMLADWQSKNICVYPLWHHFQFNTADIEMTSKKMNYQITWVNCRIVLACSCIVFACWQITLSCLSILWDCSVNYTDNISTNWERSWKA